jgi:hypothetical protein
LKEDIVKSVKFVEATKTEESKSLTLLLSKHIIGHEPALAAEEKLKIPRTHIT